MIKRDKINSDLKINNGIKGVNLIIANLIILEKPVIAKEKDHQIMDILCDNIFYELKQEVFLEKLQPNLQKEQF